MPCEGVWLLCLKAHSRCEVCASPSHETQFLVSLLCPSEVQRPSDTTTARHLNSNVLGGTVLFFVILRFGGLHPPDIKKTSLLVPTFEVSFFVPLLAPMWNILVDVDRASSWNTGPTWIRPAAAGVCDHAAAPNLLQNLRDTADAHVFGNAKDPTSSQSACAMIGVFTSVQHNWMIHGSVN